MAPDRSSESRGRRFAAALLSPLARALARAGVSANTVTAVSLAGGAAGGALLACGHFGAAAVVIAVASLGDALDGLLARTTGTASPGGAIFDAAVDRYEELFVLGGLAFYFRAERTGAVLVIALLAILGSFMVSYGSAKAEALRIPVPPGIMRRTERAILVCAGVALVPVAGLVVRAFGLASWVERAPVVVALAILALASNASAALRLPLIAREANRSPRSPPL
jgi:CDP-diacylglycerol--glycerol-3-phosphate 3-phosphatidyltransferase